MRHTLKWQFYGPMGRLNVVRNLKKPFHKFVPWVAARWPEPTYENVEKENSRTLLRIRDEFFQHETRPRQVRMFSALFRILIVMYEVDDYYSRRFDWLISKIKKTEWATEDPAWPDIEEKFGRRNLCQK